MWQEMTLSMCRFVKLVPRVLVTLVAALVCDLAPPASALPSAPSNVLKSGEGLVGVEGGLLNENLIVTGLFGTAVGRMRFPLEAMIIGAVAGYGFTDRFDTLLKVGGAFSPAVTLEGGRRSDALAGSVVVRYSVIGSRSAELGVFARMDYLSAARNDALLTVGSVPVRGEMEIRSLASAVIGMGPQWWWRVGKRKHIYPSLAAVVAPFFAGNGSFTQSLASGGTEAPAYPISDIRVVARQLFGVSANVGFDLNRILIGVGATWTSSLGGGVSLEVPF